MSDMKNLLEKMNSMSSAEHKPTGPKWPGYLKGSDSAKKARGRMVGDGGTDESVEESESFLKELNQVINSNPVKKDLFQEWQEYKLHENQETIVAEYGAPGSAIGNDTARNPAEEFAKGQERKTAKQQVQGQIAGLVAQVTGLRSQLADLNQQFPQGANPVEKAMGLQQMQAQRNGIKKQIEDLVKQIAALRQQAM
jgi:hypothetical protein